MLGVVRKALIACGKQSFNAERTKYASECVRACGKLRLAQQAVHKTLVYKCMKQAV